MHACLYKVFRCEYWIITLVLVQYMSPCLFYLVHYVWEDCWRPWGAPLSWRSFRSTVHRPNPVTQPSNGCVWMSLDEPLISDRLEGERCCVYWRQRSVSIVGTFSSEQQKINNCQIGFLVGLENWFKSWTLRIWIVQQQVQNSRNCTIKTFLKDSFDRIELFFFVPFCSNVALFSSTANLHRCG